MNVVGRGGEKRKNRDGSDGIKFVSMNDKASNNKYGKKRKKVRRFCSF
tara:strand:- start:147 stop:290 length:144 start_codon:yes stop_codon:yes gene_type:complete